MRIYPSCLYNRIREARSYFSNFSIEKVDWRSVNLGYPYNLIDLAVRMRPIVHVINSAKKINREVKLLKFEPPWGCDQHKNHINAQKVPMKRLLGAIIHETYLHIGQDSCAQQRLDIMSDKGRWIVCFKDFLGVMETYLLNMDETAETVCDMIDKRQELLSKKPEILGKIPPSIGNYDLDWLLLEYLPQRPKMKQAIVSIIFNLNDIPKNEPNDFPLSINHTYHKSFNLSISSSKIPKFKRITKCVKWGEFSRLIRSLLPSP